MECNMLSNWTTAVISSGLACQKGQQFLIIRLHNCSALGSFQTHFIVLWPKTVKIFPHQSAPKTPKGQSESRMVVNVFTRYSVEAPLPVIAAFSLLDLMPQGSLWCCKVLPPRLCWIGWGLLLGSSFLVCPGFSSEILLVQSDIHRVVLEPLLCCLGWKCVLGYSLVGRSRFSLRSWGL